MKSYSSHASRAAAAAGKPATRSMSSASKLNDFNPDPHPKLFNKVKDKLEGGIKRKTYVGWDGTRYKLRGNIDKQREIPGFNNVTKAVRAMQGLGGKPGDARGLLRRGVGLNS